ncbi:MAG: AbrB/MazE/SpoVT family DNA-binding domain-containing protein [Oscillospiraceae bacterium]
MLSKVFKGTTVTMDIMGRITVPIKVRKNFDLHYKDRFIFYTDEIDTIFVRKIKPLSLDRAVQLLIAAIDENCDETANSDEWRFLSETAANTLKNLK